MRRIMVHPEGGGVMFDSFLTGGLERIYAYGASSTFSAVNFQARYGHTPFAVAMPDHPNDRGEADFEGWMLGE